MESKRGIGGIPLGPVEAIRIAGADAVRFAQAQFANDVGSLATGAWQLGAWLNAQGRVRASFVLLRAADDVLVAWLPLGGAAAIADALKRFVFRSAVDVACIEDWKLVDATSSMPGSGDASIAACGGGFAFAIAGDPPRVAWIGPADAREEHDEAALGAWRLVDVRAGLPWIAPGLSERFLPQSLALDTLAAVRFDKGCYPGQEIAARLHFRGGNKHRLHRLRVAGDRAIESGAGIDLGGEAAGTILYAVRDTSASIEALAVVADAALDRGELDVGGARAELLS